MATKLIFNREGDAEIRPTPTKRGTRLNEKASEIRRKEKAAAWSRLLKKRKRLEEWEKRLRAKAKKLREEKSSIDSLKRDYSRVLGRIERRFVELGRAEQAVLAPGSARRPLTVNLAGRKVRATQGNRTALEREVLLAIGIRNVQRASAEAVNMALNAALNTQKPSRVYVLRTRLGLNDREVPMTLPECSDWTGYRPEEVSYMVEILVRLMRSNHKNARDEAKRVLDLFKAEGKKKHG